MPLKDDIQNFKKWAVKLGLSSENIPKDDILKTILKSKQSTFLTSLTERILPRNEVKEIKNNLLINKINNLEQQVISVNSRNVLPIELQKYLKIKELKTENSEIDSSNNVLKEKYDLLKNSIQLKSIEKVKLKQNNDTLSIKIYILEEKYDKYIEKINYENDIKDKIILYTPVKPIPDNMDDDNDVDNDEFSYKCVADMSDCLNDFYDIYFNNSDCNIVRDVHDELWKKLKIICNKISNYSIWNILLKMKNNQLENIRKLNENNRNEEDNNDINNDNISKFELCILKTEAELITILSKLCVAKNEHKYLLQLFEINFDKFLNSIKLKLNLLSSSTAKSILNNASLSNNDEIEINEKIFRFIKELNINNSRLKKIEFIKSEINNYKELINNNTIQIENHEKLLINVKKIYNDIELIFNRMQNDMKQLNDIKEKILYCKNYLKIITEKSVDQINNSNIDTTKITIDSFESSCSYDSDILCSTKIDLYNSTESSNNYNNFSRYDSTVTSYTNDDSNISFPPYLNEIIVTFQKISFENINYIPKECIFHLETNPILLYSAVCNEILLSKFELPTSILTLNGLINEIINNCDFNLLLQKSNDNIQIYKPNLEVNINQIMNEKEQQKQQIIEMLHRIQVNGIKTKHILTKIEKYLNFIINCPLKNYISSKDLFNNKKFIDYDTEFLIFYRMATLGLSIT